MAQQFKTHISLEHRLFDLHLRETLQYRDLVVMLVKKNFTAQYKQTILGPLWAIIRPLMTTVVFTVVFGNLAKLPRADVPGDFVVPTFLFYMLDKYHLLYMLNPVTPILTTFRHAAFGFGYFNGAFYALSWVISLVIFVIGLVVFSRIERTFMDTI